jgi:hypothetical protein
LSGFFHRAIGNSEGTNNPEKKQSFLPFPCRLPPSSPVDAIIIYAEASAEEIRLAFTTHEVLINGSRLDLLIADVSAQKISELREPAGRLDKFTLGNGLNVTGISVRKVESQ